MKLTILKAVFILRPRLAFLDFCQSAIGAENKNTWGYTKSLKMGGSTVVKVSSALKMTK